MSDDANPQPEAAPTPGAGAWLPLSLAAGAAAVFHAIPPLCTLAEKAGLGRQLWHPIDRLSPFLWERLIHARLTAGWWQTGLGLVEVALCIAALTQARRRLTLAAMLFAGAAILNGADWFLSFDLLHNPAINDPERRAAITFAVSELALALLLWLRVRSAGRSR
ncbi:hypothetical protein QO010_004007 [Caulobacter ginsengisoli]|uniref:Uncharacterized protein n=1 Tax=Caulobacter ginsengisoli TaxID=400775 RepID=A0ABU0IYT6_9CAUL|nr:hypothetical protein [Caulobacter ginsengisoli]MDQ0466214.1 hypothetical protein [Caulobacter ginsengisoli]